MDVDLKGSRGRAQQSRGGDGDEADASMEPRLGEWTSHEDISRRRPWFVLYSTPPEDATASPFALEDVGVSTSLVSQSETEPDDPWGMNGPIPGR